MFKGIVFREESYVWIVKTASEKQNARPIETAADVHTKNKMVRAASVC